MSEEIIETPEAERPTLSRSVELAEISRDGRNIEMLCAPFDVPAVVTDRGNPMPYQEEFARGAFDGALKAPNRVLLEFEHWTPGLSGVIGHGAHLDARDDALYGRFRVLKGPDGDKALELVDEFVARAASVFFAPIRHVRTGSGVVRRLKVHLDRVALCREGAYPQAQVLAVRTAPVLPPEELIPPFDQDLAAKLEAAGVAVPDALRTAS